MLFPKKSVIFPPRRARPEYWDNVFLFEERKEEREGKGGRNSLYLKGGDSDKQDCL
jgi:hypothetical protein